MAEITDQPSAFKCSICRKSFEQGCIPVHNRHANATSDVVDESSPHHHDRSPVPIVSAGIAPEHWDTISSDVLESWTYQPILDGGQTIIDNSLTAFGETSLVSLGASFPPATSSFGMSEIYGSSYQLQAPYSLSPLPLPSETMTLSDPSSQMLIYCPWRQRDSGIPVVASKPLSELTLVGGEDKLSPIRSRWINPLFKPPNRTVSVNQASARFMTQVLKCYPKMIARDGTLPPMIHRLQTTSRTIPTPLVDCLAWTKMWEHRTGNLDAILLNAMQGEVERLYKNVDLLAALQASLIYSIMICLDSNTTAKYGTQLVLGQLQEMAYRLLAMTEFPRADIFSKVPDRELWAIASAAQRTVLAIYVFDCVVCFLNRIPVYSCDELDFIPAPVCRRLWEAREYETWREEYGNWFKAWKGREVLMGELLIQHTESYASKRVEEWLSEADEFGMLIFTGSLLSVNSN
ncbi:conserved hypothetical protein [Talaromyces stipitatus ATCC 10500]|uniref:Uncharacterized protein n=1 Tax=Talaromyces stipitatus (strain ATCC 10500 / CBS 375.48 / QM 6759 / NRRL 1006) TaxID=441959 RepID=B8LZS1_TALSN|nr:uncharacterized protein TSTA_080860 [Talaromyces stipitatus ATCC 10500]EED20853.1 conserved hypothetical protein [Talaromyces stipitatus ATCC 10500]